MPYGWTGQWYNGASPYGPVIPGGGSIGITFSASGTYTLHYIPVNPAISCPAISKPIMINLIALPVFSIISGTIPPVICIGSGVGVVLTVDIQDPMYNYTWYKGGVVVGSGYTYTAMTAGHYVLVISKGACCQTTVSIDVEEMNCCFENPGVPFKQILSDTTIVSSEFWFDKYYINATVTVTGTAQLDLTNVDCVFGPLGKIVLKNQSFLRCNNSVLRPCSKDDIWTGILFKDQSSGWLNTSTIKNAIIAVDIVSNDFGVRLTDNSFIKCQVAVRITDSHKQQSISGNTFEVDETQLPYATTPNEYWGIKMYRSQMAGLIAQNTFRQVQPQNSSNIYYGIYSELTNYTASQNEFNDMYRAIDIINNPDVVAIEQNTFKINHVKERVDIYQIRATNCDNPVLIYENQMDNGVNENIFVGAIYCENTIRTHIKDNQINAFLVGVMARFTKDINITSNNITGVTNLGIGLMSTTNSVASCNTINSMATNLMVPIGIRDFYGDGSSHIYSNCIFNMYTAIHLMALTPGVPIPTIANNYMYNYSHAGVDNRNYAGSIGLPGGATAAGRNTFMSNNGATGTTFDIISTPVISEGGNFGILMTSGVSSTTLPDLFYSTAACSHQIQQSYANNQLDKYNVCDVYYLKNWVTINPGGIYTLNAATSVSAAIISEAIHTGNREILGQLMASMLSGSGNAKQTGDAMLASTMDKNLAARMIVTASLAISDRQLASAFMASQELSTINPDLRTILEITIALAANPILSEQQRSTLLSIDAKEHEYSPLARDLVQAKNGEHDYKFFKLPPVAPSTEAPSGALSRISNSLTVYPVPSSQQISVEHHVKDANVSAIKIISASGMEVTSFKYTVQSGVVNIDVSALASGVYSVMLVTDSESKTLMTGRFIIVR